MKNWDLADARQSCNAGEVDLVCDEGAVSAIIALRQGNAGRSASALLRVAAFVEGASWLRAVLIPAGGGASALSAELRSGGEVRVAFQCQREPDEAEIEAASRVGFRLEVTVSLESAASNRDLLVVVEGLRLQTRRQPKPRVELTFPQLPPLSRFNAWSGTAMRLCDISIRQAGSTLRYTGERSRIDLSAKLYLKAAPAGGEVEIEVLTQVGQASWPATRGHELPPGESIECAWTAEPAALFEAAKGARRVELRMEWKISHLLADRVEDEEGSRSLELALLQDEILALRFEGVVRVPKMTQGEPEPVVVPAVELPHPDNRDRAREAGGEAMRFEVLPLDRSWERLSVFAGLAPADVDPIAWAATRSPVANGIAFDSIREVRLSIDEIAGDRAPGDGDERLLVVLMAEKAGELAIGAATAPVNWRKGESRHMVCVDFGASATAAWFGPIAPVQSRRLVPLGEFVYALSGAHDEYEPGRAGDNCLAPSVIGLDPQNHLRSRRDPLSLGDLSSVGSDAAATARRLTLLERRYDVSLPAEGDTEPAFAIPDLKRRLLNARSRVPKPVAELQAGSLRHTRDLDLEALTRDVFAELGGYLVPNAMQGAPAAGQGDEPAPFDAWLDSPAGSIAVVVTHPSGIPADKRRIYGAAGSAFARAFGETDADRPPILIPEALAAAFYGIGRQTALAKGSQVFACIDIGASTIDASLVEAEFRGPGEIHRWKVLAHFGLTVGGANLDEALLALALRLLRKLFPNGGHVHGDLLLEPRFGEDETLRQALLPAIREAKRKLSAELLRAARAGRPYRWAEGEPANALRIGLRGIVVGRTSGQPLQRRDDPLEADGSARLRVAPSGDGGQDAWLEIRPQLLDADAVEVEPSRSDPRSVVRLLGRAVPAMLIREAARQQAQRPKWIVTGRASLWPPIYSGIARTIEAMNGGEPLAAPFDPHDMKNAIVYGARSLAISGLEVDDGTRHPYAMVSYRPADGGIAEIRYLPTEQRERDGVRTPFIANSWLSRVLPGLGEPGDARTISRDEIVRLFTVFGQRAAIDVRQMRAPANTFGANRDVEITWEQIGEKIRFRIGDVTVEADESRIAGG